jgi:cytidylate kinase
MEYKNMAIITISRGSYSKGKEVAEMVASNLGYDCISREVLIKASDHFNIPEVKLIRAIHDAPSILERFGRKRQAFVAFIRSELACRVSTDNVVYHGLAGHLLLKGIPHVLKVRIIAQMEDRIITAESKRAGIGKEEARTLLLNDDQERRKWTQSLYGVDPWDNSLYDLVIHIHKLQVSDAVELICDAATRDPFKTTDNYKRKMDDFAIACQIKAALVDPFSEVGVTSHYGNVLIFVKSRDRVSQKLKKRVKELDKEIKGINNLEIHFGLPLPPDAV